MRALLFLLIGLIGCSQSEHRSLKTSHTITHIFSDSEIGDLEKILTFFEKQICLTPNQNLEDSVECYRSYLNKMSKNLYSNGVKLDISFSQQKEIYDKIDKATFDEIWWMSRKIISRSKYDKDTLKAITFQTEGKYFKFLERTAKDYDVIKNYYTACKAAGDLSPNAIASIMAYPEKYDVRDIRIRLIIAIHYLMLNDDMNRFERIKK